MTACIVRRGTLAAALAAALALPAAAGAQSLDPTAECAPGDALCVGKEKLGERASAECRRTADAVPGRPVPDPTCHPPVGRRVDRSLVAAHRDSWTHRSLAFQYALAADVPFRDAPWIGTHNSYNSTSEFPTLSHTDSNQQLSLVDQLELDVRSLEIDVHWAPSPRAGAGAPATAGRAPVVCHAREERGVHVGCTSERLLGDVLADVAGWLNRPENRREVVLLYLEDHLEGNHAAARAVLESVLRRPGEPGGSLVYRAGPDGSPCRSLPLEATRADVLAAGAQVVIVGDCGAGWSGHVFTWGSDVRREERPRGYTAETCGGIDRDVYASRLVRFYEDSTFVTPASARAGLASPDDGIDPATAAAMARCGVDLLGLDQLLPDDGRLEALVWSWAPGQPDASGGDCAYQRVDSRWASADCRRPRRVACRLPDGGWTVPPARARFDRASHVCHVAGGELDVPRTGYDNAVLRDAAGAAEVWLDRRS